jgi:hypothetical protein
MDPEIPRSPVIKRSELFFSGLKSTEQMGTKQQLVAGKPPDPTSSTECRKGLSEGPDLSAALEEFLLNIHIVCAFGFCNLGEFRNISVTAIAKSNGPWVARHAELDGEVTPIPARLCFVTVRINHVTPYHTSSAFPRTNGMSRTNFHPTNRVCIAQTECSCPNLNVFRHQSRPVIIAQGDFSSCRSR